MRRLLSPFLVLPVVVSLLAGCGGRGDEPPPPSGPQADYVAEVTRICTERQRAVESALARARTQATRQRLPPGPTVALGLTFALPVSARYLREAYRVDRPANDQARLEAFYRRYLSATRTLYRSRSAIRAGGDAPRIRAQQRFARDTAGAQRFGERYGLDACVKNRNR